MPRKRLADPVKLSVVFEPDDGGWHVYVPSLQGCRTWGRSLSEARRNIREAISLQEEAFQDADAVARDAVFEEELRLDESVRVLLDNAEAAKARADAAAAQAKAAAVAAARRLAAFTSLRDAGELLGLSQEGVRKLVRAPAEAYRASAEVLREMTLKDVTVVIDTRALEGIVVDHRGVVLKGVVVENERAGVFVVDDQPGVQKLVRLTHRTRTALTKAIEPVTVPSSRPPAARPRRSRAAHSGRSS